MGSVAGGKKMGLTLSLMTTAQKMRRKREKMKVEWEGSLSVPSFL